MTELLSLKAEQPGIRIGLPGERYRVSHNDWDTRCDNSEVTQPTYTELLELISKCVTK